MACQVAGFPAVGLMLPPCPTDLLASIQRRGPREP
jgi:hypothetical protein